VQKENMEDCGAQHSKELHVHHSMRYNGMDEERAGGGFKVDDADAGARRGRCQI
jgi:hypothetical protein